MNVNPVPPARWRILMRRDESSVRVLHSVDTLCTADVILGLDATVPYGFRFPDGKVSVMFASFLPRVRAMAQYL